MHLAIINHSPDVTADQARTMAAAVGHQVRYDFAPAYGLNPTEVIFYADPTQVPAGSYVIGIFQDADQPGALGYHTEDQNSSGGVSVYGKVFTSVTLSQPGAQVLGGLVSLTSVLSHEVLELIADPHVNSWCDTDSNILVALEVCDPVESDVYFGKPSGTTVSNFVLPAWFDAQNARGPFDHLGRLTGPFSMTKGGYLIERAGGPEQQAVARYGDDYPEWRKPGKLSPFARTAQRLAEG